MKEILDFNVLWNFFPYEYVSATLLEILKKKTISRTCHYCHNRILKINDILPNRHMF